MEAWGDRRVTKKVTEIYPICPCQHLTLTLTLALTLTGGYYVKPTLFVDVNNQMDIARQEIFGPVLVVIPFETEEEAVDIANDTLYGSKSQGSG